MNYFLILSILILSCSSNKLQNKLLQTTNNEEIKIGFRNPAKNSEEFKRLIKDSLKPEITLFFESGFKDTLLIYFNEELYLNDYFQNNEGVKNFTYNYSTQKNKDVFLKIEELNGKYCLEIKIIKGYRILGISRFNGKWWVNYSNFILNYD